MSNTKQQHPKFNANEDRTFCFAIFYCCETNAEIPLIVTTVKALVKNNKHAIRLQDSFWALKMVKRGFICSFLSLGQQAVFVSMFSIYKLNGAEKKKNFPTYSCIPNYLFQMPLDLKKPSVTSFKYSVSNTFLTFHSQNNLLQLSFANYHCKLQIIIQPLTFKHFSL